MGPELRWTTRPDAPTAVVLVLHGGSGTSHIPTQWVNLSVLRMLPVAWAIARAGRGSFAVARLKFAVRGWNGAEASPVGDARWALDQVAEAYPGVRVAVVGHSMGGRTALMVADDPRVVDLVGMAPWVVGSDGVHVHDGVTTLVIHGLGDRMTSAEASRQLVEGLQARGLVASFVGLRSADHPMLRRATAWDGLVGSYLAASLGTRDAPVPVPAGAVPGPDSTDVAVLGAAASTRSLITVI